MSSKIHIVLGFIVTLMYGTIYLCGALAIAFQDTTTALPASMSSLAIALLLVTEGMFGSAYPKILTDGDGAQP